MVKNQVRQKLRNEQYEDEKALNVVTLETDNERKNSKKILVDLLEKAIDSDLLIKNSAKQINTVISKEIKKERRVLTVGETELFFSYAKDTFTTIYMQRQSRTECSLRACRSFSVMAPYS